MKRVITVPVCLLLSLLVPTVLAQQSKPFSEKELKLQRQRAEAISTVKQVANEAALWDNKKAAVQVLTDAADLLWDETPGQSSEWLNRAWVLLDQVSGAPKKETLKEFFTRSEQSELRTAVLSVARKHDTELAEKLLKQLSQKQTDEKKERGAFDDRTARSEQLLQMAQQAVDSQPEVAFALAEQSLTDGISYSLQNILTSLRKKNTELSNRLFDLALARFSSRDPDPSEAQVLAGYLFQSGFTFAANSSGQTILVVNPAQQNLPSVAASEPQRARNFLTAVYQAVLTRPLRFDSSEDQQRAQQILLLGNRVIRRYDTFAPELAQPAKAFLAHLQQQLAPDSSGAEATADATKSAPVTRVTTKPPNKEELYEQRIAELEDLADKEANTSFRNVAYARAVVRTNPDDYERAKQIAKKISDDALRADTLSFALYRAALFFIERNETVKAMELAVQISDVTRGAVAKISLAQRLLTMKPDAGALRIDQQRAFDLLTNLESDLKKNEPSVTLAKISLARAAVLGELDPAQALLALDQSVQLINKLDNFDLRDTGAPDLGLGLFPSSGATVARPKLRFDLNSAIAPLVVKDFDQVSAIVERLVRKDMNGEGRLEVAKLFLKKTAPVPKLSSAPLSH
jgi:hypothetical protein